MMMNRQQSETRSRVRLRMVAALTVVAPAFAPAWLPLPENLSPAPAAAEEVSWGTFLPVRMRLRSNPPESILGGDRGESDSFVATVTVSQEDESILRSGDAPRTSGDEPVTESAGTTAAAVAPDSLADPHRAAPESDIVMCDDCDSPALTCQCLSAACPSPWWAHRSGIVGEFLLLRPGSTDLTYAVEQTDPDPNDASPTGPMGIVAIDSQPGFRVGLTHAASECSSLVASYTWWEGDAESQLSATGINVLDSTVFHPSVATSGGASLQAAARQRIRFQMADIGYRHLWRASETTAVNWIGGLRYGNLSQTLGVDQTVQAADGLTSLRTDVDFDGFGLTGGLDFERYSPRSGLSIYGRTLASLLAGEWDASYRQTNQLGGGVIANRYEDFRVTPVLEAELGLAWTSPQDRCRLHAGMQISGWYDSISTRSYVDGVRNGTLTGVGETITFSGLTTGMEWRF